MQLFYIIWIVATLLTLIMGVMLAPRRASESDQSQQSDVITSVEYRMYWPIVLAASIANGLFWAWLLANFTKLI